VSHQIKTLEEDLGFQLFERRPRAIELTSAGRLLLEELDPAMRELQQIIEKHRDSAGVETVHLALPPFFASELFVVRLDEFRARNPDVNLVVESADSRLSEPSKRADLIILLEEHEPPHLQVECLFSLQLVPACSTSLLPELRDDPAAFLNECTRIVHSARPDAWSRWAEAAGMTNVRPAKVIEMNSMIAVARAAERGVGVALLPLQLSAQWFQSGALVPVSNVQLDTDDTYYLVRPDERTFSDSVEKLWSWIVESFAATDEKNSVCS
jgi:LysR family glycine cleavage system transcriptional activator